MIRVEIKSNLEDVRRRFGALTKNIEEKATVTALNRTLTTCRAAAARELKKHYGMLPVSKIKRRISAKRATRATLTATLIFSGSRFRLLGNWPITKTVTPRGVRVRLRGVSGGRTSFRGLPNLDIEMSGAGNSTPVPKALLSHAFIQRSRKTKVPNVWIRESVVEGHGGGRYPIGLLLVPGLGRAFTDKKIDETMRRLAAKIFTKNFAAELKYRSR